MKVKSAFRGNNYRIPHSVQKSFRLNDRYHSAKISLDNIGNYTLDVPYGVTDATARRSMFYKSSFADVTQQMIDAYSSATFAFTHIALKCSKIETDILYKKRLQILHPEIYSKKTCPEPQPTKDFVAKELMVEANQKYFSLFKSNRVAKQKFVKENIDITYQEKMRHWEEVITYFDYVESIIEAKKNKAYYERYIQEKTDIENRLYGPDLYVQQQLNEILKDNDIPFPSLPFEFDYDQKKGIVEIIIDIPMDIPIPREYAQLYSSGKLWVKSKTGLDIANEKRSFYLGLQYFIASKLFGLALNINTVRVSIVESLANTGISWIEFDREILRQLIISQSFDLYASAQSFNHYFEFDAVTGLKGVAIGRFSQKISDIITNSSNSLSGPIKPKQPNETEVSIADAKIIAATIINNQSIIDKINVAEESGQKNITLTKGVAAVLDEIKSSVISPNITKVDRINNASSFYGPVEYAEYPITEHIDESDSDYETIIKNFIQNIIDREAPISRDVLNRRICQAMGISRVSARLNEKIVAILLDMGLYLTVAGKIYFWSDAVRPENLRNFRKGGNRDALDIVPQEILNCILYKIYKTKRVEKIKLLRDVANEFGFTRMGVNVLASMKAGLHCGIENGTLTEDGSDVCLNE